MQVAEGHVELLGAAVGHDPNSITTWYKNKVDGWAARLELLADSCLPLQGALLLLKQLSAATPNYTSRILPPSITKNALATFDRDIIRVLEQRLAAASKANQHFKKYLCRIALED